MPWLRHRLRDADVWARVDDNAALIKDSDGRVEIVYKPAGFEPGEPAEVKPRETRAPGAAPRRSGGDAAATGAPADAIHVWTDGACSGNPGRAGLGVVILGDGAGEREISEYLGEATNNIAELTAILRGLEAVSDRTRPVIVYSDSAYSIGLLTKAWKAKKNVELVDELRALVRTFRDLRFVKVAGHAGIVLNERVDQLATGA